MRAMSEYWYLSLWYVPWHVSGEKDLSLSTFILSEKRRICVAYTVSCIRNLESLVSENT